MTTDSGRRDAAPKAREVLEFWLADSDLNPGTAKSRKDMWFGGSPEVDAEIARRFAGLVDEVASGRCDDWFDHPAGQLAQIIVLDQFPRNLYRNTARAFAYDGKALELTRSLLDTGVIAALGWISRAFALMPMQHSEDASVQERSVEEFERLARQCPKEYRPLLEDNAGYARLHRDIVARFGRFPHRNKVLGRQSTREEEAWLADGAPTFGQGGRSPTGA